MKLNRTNIRPWLATLAAILCWQAGTVHAQESATPSPVSPASPLHNLNPETSTAGNLEVAVLKLPRLESRWVSQGVLAPQQASAIVRQYLVRQAETPEEGMKRLLRKLGENTRPGTYYPAARQPANLEGFRRCMLYIGNFARRDPDYRKKHSGRVDVNGDPQSPQYALDLSGNTAMPLHPTDKRSYQLFKKFQTPPYFHDLLLNEQLCQAAQFHAEYMAAQKDLTHTGPANYKQQEMSEFWMRSKYFGYNFHASNEYVGEGPADSMPGMWLLADTGHFHGWFNVGAEFVEIGLGAASTPDGGWYGCALMARGNPRVTYWAKLENIQPASKIRIVNGDIAASALSDSGDQLTWQPAGSTNDQLWQLQQIQGNTYRIINVGTGKVLAADKTTAVAQQNAPAQLWQIRPVGLDYYEFLNAASGQRLGATRRTNSNQVVVFQSAANDMRGQWTFQIIP